MQLSDYLRLLRRRAWIIVLATVFGGLGAYLATKQEAKVYQASTQLIVSTSLTSAPGSGSTGAASAEEEATTVSQIASRLPAVEAAEKAVGVSGGISRVTASGDGTSAFVLIEVTGSDSTNVAKVANAFASTLPGVLRDLKQIPSGTTVDLTTVQPAVPNSAPISPAPHRNLAIGLLVGLFLGLAAAVGREALDRRLRDSKDLEKLVGYPLLGVIPLELSNERLPAATHPRSARSESYRLVRTNLQFTDVLGLPRCVLVTSPSAGEGKTSLAANLAVSCALAGERVVIVDADLRRPMVNQHFGVTNQPGLGRLLAGGGSAKSGLRSALDGLVAVLPAGSPPPNPSELLGSAAMSTILRQLERDFDRVIVDGPPVLPVADAVKLANMTSGVIVVARLGKTKREELQACKTSLERVSARVLGIVGNGAKTREDSTYGYGSRALYEQSPDRSSGRRRSSAPNLDETLGVAAPPRPATMQPPSTSLTGEGLEILAQQARSDVRSSD